MFCLPPRQLPPAERQLDLAADPADVRLRLARLLQSTPLLTAAWRAGVQSATPGTAFFCGYQVAMRQLDAGLAPDQWAAFCISERGLRSLRDMSSEIRDDGRLYGAKSHVMLAGSGLDRLYVVARDGGELICVPVHSGSDGLSVAAAGKVQPFLPDVPHFPVTFDGVITDGIFCRDTNERLNKPFRYWEDVCVLLAQAGWITVQSAAEEQATVQRAAERLATAFTQQPEHYHLPALDAVEHLLEVLDDQAAGLPQAARGQWQRDRALMVLAQPLRDRVRSRLSAPSL